MINVLMSRGVLGSKYVVDELKGIIKKEHKVAILLYSFFEKQLGNESRYQTYYAKGSEYYEKMLASFSPYGIEESQIAWINYFNTPVKDAIEMIKDADILYIPGGSPSEMMERIKNRGLLETIEAHQKIYIGSSAGAMIQMHQYHISVDKDFNAFSYQEGLNLLHGFSIEVHYNRRKKQKAALRKVFRAYRHPIFTIPEYGAIVMNGEEIVLLGGADLMYDSKGIYRRNK